jgi:hypothetical protein
MSSRWTLRMARRSAWAIGVVVLLTAPVAACSDDEGGPGGAVTTQAGEEYSFGEWIPSRLEGEDDIQEFTFPALRGEPIRVMVHTPDARTLDPMVRLLDPGGEVIAENDDIEPRLNRNSELVGAAGNDAVYTIEVEAYDGSGAFELVVERGDMVGERTAPLERWNTDEQDLKRLVGTTLRPTCRPEAPRDTELAVLSCLDSEGEPVTISSYPDANEMQGDYGGIVSFEEVRENQGTDGDCPAEFAWGSSDGASGRLICSAASDRTRLAYTWDCDLYVLVTATRFEGGVEDSLYRLWQTEAGPLCT